MPPAPRDPEIQPSRRTPRAAAPAATSVSPSARRRTLQIVLVFVTLVLVINALIGERGLMETLRARKQYDELVQSIDQLKAENARLRDEARRLRSDPATIEALARQQLGLIKPGELLFIIKNVRPASTAR